MKYLLLTIFLVGLSNIVYGAEKLSKLPKGTEIRFEKALDFSYGNKSKRIGSGNCSLHASNKDLRNDTFQNVRSIYVSRSEFERAWMTQNPLTGEPIRVLPSVKIRIKGSTSKIVCRSEAAIDLETSDFTIDGKSEITLP